MQFEDSMHQIIFRVVAVCGDFEYVITVSEICKFGDFNERFNGFAKYILVHKIAKFNYFVKLITFKIS